LITLLAPNNKKKKKKKKKKNGFCDCLEEIKKEIVPII
jgi:hypothetical protein